MSIYSGFGTRKQETIYNNIVFNTLVLMAERLFNLAQNEDQSKFYESESDFIKIRTSQFDTQAKTDINFHHVNKNTAEDSNLFPKDQKVSQIAQEWNDKFYKYFKYLRSMEKLKHLEPKFSDAIERLAKKIKRQQTKTANRMHIKARNDDKTTEYNRDFSFDNNHSISQDQTEYILKQNEIISEGIDGLSNIFEQDKKNCSHILADSSYTSDVLNGNKILKAIKKEKQLCKTKTSRPSFKVINQDDLKGSKLGDKDRIKMITIKSNV